MFRDTLYHTPIEFIQESLEKVIPQICEINPYWGFINITISIEFLGKCIWEGEFEWSDYDIHNPSKFFYKSFEIEGLKNYKCIKGDLWKLLRNGYSHSLAPKKGILLTEREDVDEVLGSKPYKIKLNRYLGSFIQSCKEVRSRKYPDRERLFEPFIGFTRDRDGNIDSSGYTF